MAQQIDTTNPQQIAERCAFPLSGRIIAIDPGMKRVGVAVSDESQTIARPIRRLERTSWKNLLADIKDIVREFDAVALVIGLPLASDGTESEMSAEARDMARKLELSLEIAVFLQDERVTSYEAKAKLWERGISLRETRDRVDSEAAALILTDFLTAVEQDRQG
ncbi:Holliday junction resolvase RuvX [Leptolyngbya sp. 7M]|uniref:Holliday junction resolvase RuvX n=1 Tax=Leptolyngbya sp. 7M TaxID=2812896 RepID=UPI001B8D131B|nr:Holliday junction resolvase RuvX [Leptolyngbya sp. 7M]QYO66978.1 Holliday junction resolvase RuvX [Leptolyngbya sp. 7M]